MNNINTETAIIKIAVAAACKAVSVFADNNYSAPKEEMQAVAQAAANKAAVIAANTSGTDASWETMVRAADEAVKQTMSKVMAYKCLAAAVRNQ